MATAIVPGIYDAELADQDIAVRTEDAHRVVKQLAREEGILAGVSSGAALFACFEVARSLPSEQRRRDRYSISGFRRKIFERSILERAVSGTALRISDALVRRIQAHGSGDISARMLRGVAGK